MTNVVFLPYLNIYRPSGLGKESSRMMGAGRWQVLIMIKFKLSCPAYDTV